MYCCVCVFTNGVWACCLLLACCFRLSNSYDFVCCFDCLGLLVVIDFAVCCVDLVFLFVHLAVWLGCFDCLLFGCIVGCSWSLLFCLLICLLVLRDLLGLLVVCWWLVGCWMICWCFTEVLYLRLGCLFCCLINSVVLKRACLSDRFYFDFFVWFVSLFICEFCLLLMLWMLIVTLVSCYLYCVLLFLCVWVWFCWLLV